MLLCIWTAVHLNLPEHKKENQQFYRKIGWLILGLLAPELVVWNAWMQRKEAKNLSFEMRRRGFMAEEVKVWTRVRTWFGTLVTRTQVFLLLKADEVKSEGKDRQRPPNGRSHFWTDIHSWYVVMGGIVFEDLAPKERQFMPGNRQRVTLTTGGIQSLLEDRSHLIPDISREHIEDKSKSDGLTKLLTCWQATYFCVQCIYRLSQKLSISLLELNVFAHALCALLLFAIWWEKPRDVQEPTSITDHEGMDLCAWLFLEGGHDTCRSSPLESYPSSWEVHEPCSDFREVVSPTSVTVRPPCDGSINIPLLAEHDSDHHRYSLTFGPSPSPCLKVLDTYWTVRVSGWLLKRYNFDGEILELDNSCVQRLARAYGFVKNKDVNWFPRGGAIVDRHRNWHIDFEDIFDGASVKIFAWTAAGLTVSGGCYGGLHLTAWATPFPSHAETVLWRAASITILVTGPFAVVIGLCNSIIEAADAWIVEKETPLIEKYLEWLLLLVSISLWSVLALSMLWYTVCRAFIVVESFIMLTHIPNTALTTPTWTQHIPHIS